MKIPSEVSTAFAAVTVAAAVTGDRFKNFGSIDKWNTWNCKALLLPRPDSGSQSVFCVVLQFYAFNSCLKLHAHLLSGQLHLILFIHVYPASHRSFNVLSTSAAQLSFKSQAVGQFSVSLYFIKRKLWFLLVILLDSEATSLLDCARATHCFVLPCPV